MALKKSEKNHAERSWEENDKKYPRKRGVCSCCGQKDEVKLSYDLRNYLCINQHACMLRFSKNNAERRK